MGYMRDDRQDRADTLIGRVARIVGDNSSVQMARGVTSQMRGDVANAVRELRRSNNANPNATVTQMWYGFALQGIADYETLLKVGLPEHRMLAFAALGRLDEAYGVLEDFDLNGTFPPRVLLDIGRVFNSNNASRAFIDYVLEQYGTLDTLLQTYPIKQGWGIGYAGQLAYAYLQIDDEQTFRALLELARADLDAEYAEGANNWVVRYSEAEYAALTGDRDGALLALQAALDSSYRVAQGFDSPIFRNLEGDPQFEELRQTLANYVDAEREKLGMPPYRPVPLVEEPKNSSVWQP